MDSSRTESAQSFYFACRKEQNQAGHPTTSATADTSQQIMTGPGPPISQAATSGRLINKKPLMWYIQKISTQAQI